MMKNYSASVNKCTSKKDTDMRSKNKAASFLGILTATGIILTSGLSLASDPMEDAIKARKALMTLYGMNIGQLGAMAKGEMEYDPAKAKTAAVNLNTLASMNHSAVWPMGSDSTAMPDKTKAKLIAWTTYPASAKISKNLIAASASMVAVADQGLDKVQANIGAIGKTCGACHNEFREK